MEIDYDKLAAAILRQQQQQQPSVVPGDAILNPSEQERGASSSNTGKFQQSTELSEINILRLYKNQWQRILVYRQPARTRVVRNFAIGGTSRPEGRGVGLHFGPVT